MGKGKGGLRMGKRDRVKGGKRGTVRDWRSGKG